MSSVFITSVAVCGRSAARFSRQRMTSSASSGGSPGRRTVIGSGSTARWAPSTACAVRPANTGSPVRISYAVAPKA